MSLRTAARPVRMTPGTRSKYRAVPVVVDGIRFASKAESRRYGELKLLEKAGEIRQLRLQVPLGLHASASGGSPLPIGQYVADFMYEERQGQDWCLRIEDVKGVRTPLYRWKKKHVEAQYGITIREV